ncbi:hypothetical protein N787_04880 [Arenimonas metalli CF5-1]|uniref:Uncharacterized protein n=1 Tax=Arenimonas metalli CF5-1 TaxID=1384056 RepID=A0A091AR45_9GAMM|nr:hypothetical protein N787_04880 [Arenimonas metalli CF5-1]
MRQAIELTWAGAWVIRSSSSTTARLLLMAFVSLQSLHRKPAVFLPDPTAM